MTQQKYIVDGEHFSLLPIEDQTVETFLTSLRIKAGMDEATALKVLEQPGMREAIIAAAKSYSTYPSEEHRV